MPNKPYTAYEIATLKTLRSRGMSYAAIAEQLSTGRTAAQLRRHHSKLSRLEQTSIPARQSHTRADEFTRDTIAADTIKQTAQLETELAVERQKVADLNRLLRRNVVTTATESNTFKFAIISDTHYGSLYHDAGALRSFLTYARDNGIVDVLHAGDVLEGEKMHFGQDRELSHAGVTQQLESLESFPHDLKLKVKFITGNHDICYYKSAGIDIGAAIASATGWEHIGDMFGEVEYSAPNGIYRVCIMHPGGGTAYALSYKLQKIIEQWAGGHKPHMIAAGHFHKALLMPSYRNVAAIHPGCFQKQTPFMASKSLAAHVAGVIVTIHAGGDGELWNSVNVEFATYY